jgi:hypothetical protein
VGVLGVHTVRRNVAVPADVHARLVGLQADAMKKAKRQVSLGEVVAALVNYALTPHEGGGGTHHLVWTDRMGED